MRPPRLALPLIVTALLALAILPRAGADPPSPRMEHAVPAEKITFGGEKKIPGYVLGPKGSPAVIVLQEWWGINEEIKVRHNRALR